jgi:HEAT repeats
VRVGQLFHDQLTIAPEDVSVMSGSSRDVAESLFGRFQSVVSALPQEIGSNLQLYRMLRTSVEALPEEQRTMLHAVLLDRALDDPLAERYIGTMSDTELARLVVDVAQRFERDPAEMAERLVAMRLRSDDLVELTSSVAAGRTDHGTLLAGDEVEISAAASEPRSAGGGRRDGLDVESADASELMVETVGDLLGQSLLAREQEDVSALRGEFPSTDVEMRGMASQAVRDYLLVEDDLERMERVLASWMATARDGLRSGELAVVRQAVDVLEGPRAASADRPDRRVLFELYRRETPDPDLLRTLVERAKEPDGQATVEELLAPFEEISVTALLELLDDEEERHERSVIISLATDLARNHLDVVTARVNDRRVSVARDAVTVAYRAGGAAALPTLDRASRHPSPDVREEAVRGLISVAGASAVARLLDLARDNEPRVRTLAVAGLGGLMGAHAIDGLAEIALTSSDPAIRRGALEHLARHPTPEARARLKQLSTGKPKPGLPRPLRRFAKALMRR